MKRYYKVYVGGDWVLVLATNSYTAKLVGIDLFDSKLVNVEIAKENEVTSFIRKFGANKIVVGE